MGHIFCLSNRAETRRQLFLRLSGVGHSTPWSIWFTLFIFSSHVLSLIALLGCVTPSIKSQYLFRVDRDELIDSTIGKTNVTVQALNLDELPLHWSWGISGVCAKYYDGSVACHRALIPMVDMQDAIAFSVNERLGPSERTSSLAKHMRPWNLALEELAPGLPSDTQTKTLWKAAVALTITSVILSFLLSLLGVLSLSVLRGKTERWMLYAGAMVDLAALLSAGVLFIYAMDNGPRAILERAEVKPIEAKSWIGGGYFLLFASVFLKMISIGTFCAVLMIPEMVVADCCCQCRRKDKKNRSRKGMQLDPANSIAENHHLY